MWRVAGSAFFIIVGLVLSSCSSVGIGLVDLAVEIQKPPRNYTYPRDSTGAPTDAEVLKYAWKGLAEREVDLSGFKVFYRREPNERQDDYYVKFVSIRNIMNRRWPVEWGTTVTFADESVKVRTNTYH